MGDYHGSDCEEVDGAFANVLVDVKVLGETVGYQFESNASCPTVPITGHFRYDPQTYTTYRTAYSLGSAYRLSTLATTIRVRLNNGSDVACMAANITPDLGPVASNLLKGIPVAILILSGLISMALKTSRSRSSMFRYEIANSQRDPVEPFLPGIGDCLQYMQFIFMAGCLTLSYPGFFKPIVSQFSWSSLIYANGPIAHEFLYPGVQDNIYSINGTYGLELMAQVLGATTMTDLWTNATINLSVMVLILVVMIQLASLFKWMWRLLSTPQSGNIEMKADFLAHIQHAGWSVLRMVLHYYIFPIVTFSLYQSHVAKFFPVYQTFLAVLLVSLLAVSLGFVVRYLGLHDKQNLFFTESSLPRSSQSWLSDALYGLPLLRGIIIGGLQISGIGQIVALAICEIALIVALFSHRYTSPVWKGISIAVVRLTTILMSCAFLPSVGLSEGTKGYVGYCILSFHAAVLIFGFFANSILNVLKLVLRRKNILDPHSVDPEDRPPVFGLDQLSRRSKRNMSFSHLPALSPDPACIPHHSVRGSSEESHSMDGHFYRQPRSRNYTSMSPSEATGTVESIPSSSDTESRGSTETDFEERRSDVDYSVREADQYYRRREIVMGSSEPPRESDTFSRWRPKKEKGFEVVRSSS
ncbi:hypothetical protein MW887_006282 [Aspergillus wentii]|nr:hypothetical protein MW887_006282 [Aspergillus wentii]